MTTISNLPTYDQNLITNTITNKVWYFFFQALHQGTPIGTESIVTPTSSPFTFIAPSRGTLIVQGGTVSLINFTRNGTTNYNTGQTQGMLPVSFGDSLIVYYSVQPSITFIPQ